MERQSPRSNLSQSERQSAFLPQIEKTSTRLKETVVLFAFLGLGIYALRRALHAIILAMSHKLPADFPDKQSYVLGLQAAAATMIHTFYRPVVNRFHIETREITADNIKEQALPRFASLQEHYDLWAEQKGSHRIYNVKKFMKERMHELASLEITPATTKKPISIWAKAEIDLRAETQMQMLEKMKEEAVYCWLSSHPDCSKRCAPWQGKLVDIVHHAELPGFKMKTKLDGHTVYSLVDIMNQIDQWGYKNNIIVGFNCRHYLLPWTPRSLPPKRFSAQDIKKERAINAKLRAMEREIRKIKQEAKLYARIKDRAMAERLQWDAAKKIAYYKSFADKNGFAWYQYRIEV